MAIQPDGSVYQSFHPIMDHLVAVNIGSRTLAVVQPDRKIITAGFFTQVNGLNRPGLARLNSDGSTDTSFEPTIANDEYDQPGAYHITAMALQASK